MLIYSMSVSVDGFIADRDGAFGWTASREELLRLHLAVVGDLGGYLLGRRLYETMRVWERDPPVREHRAPGRVRGRLVRSLSPRDLRALRPRPRRVGLIIGGRSVGSDSLAPVGGPVTTIARED